MDLVGSEYVPKGACCDNGNEHSGIIKCGAIHEQLVKC